MMKKRIPNNHIKKNTISLLTIGFLIMLVYSKTITGTGLTSITPCEEIGNDELIMSLQSDDSAVFMPAVRKLAIMSAEEAANKYAKAVPYLKNIIEKHQTVRKIKEPAIQALNNSGGTLETFRFLSERNWNQQFFDSGRKNWEKQWHLDGIKATVKNTKKGMEFHAGAVPFDDSSHAVLWTEDYFQGDLMIEYDYTRLDDRTRFVNILYIQATGSGDGPHLKDIMKWKDLRQIPAMRLYYSNMYLYHVSYAAFTNRDGENKPGYIRARRYMATKKLRGTELKPDYLPDGLFAKDVKHHIKVIKTHRHIFMKITSPIGEKLCHWYNKKFPPITEGYIGLRHMCTRAARYSQFTVSEMK